MSVTSRCLTNVSYFPFIFPCQYPVCKWKKSVIQICKTHVHYHHWLLISVAVLWELILFLLFVFYRYLNLQNLFFNAIYQNKWIAGRDNLIFILESFKMHLDNESIYSVMYVCLHISLFLHKNLYIQQAPFWTPHWIWLSSKQNHNFQVEGWNYT